MFAESVEKMAEDKQGACIYGGKSVNKIQINFCADSSVTVCRGCGQGGA